MTEVSLFRLYLLRAMYLLIAAGLATTVWPWIFRSWEATVPDHGKPVLVGRLR